jgi:hemolysin activation/secretion protein
MRCTELQIRLLACIFSAGVVTASIATAQVVRPNAGTLSAPQPLPPSLPVPSGPLPVVPEVTPSVPAGPSVSITPSAFEFEGNTLFSSAELAALLADRINRTTDLAGLAEAARVIANYYRERDYLLTEVYLPEQSFQASGGTVKIAIIEAHIGRVRVEVDGDNEGRISKSFAESGVLSNLKQGDPVTGYALDRTVLLLRDLNGYDAEATVEPGLNVGDADIVVAIRAKGPRLYGYVSLDNYGTRAAGQIRATLNLNINNLLGQGDVVTLSAQQNDVPGSRLYGLSYNVPVGGAGTQIGFSVERLEYALEKQFAALGATGTADVVTLNLSHPFIRSRTSNLYGLLSLEQKKLSDETATPAQQSDREINAIRFGFAGQYVDNIFGWSGFNVYRLNATAGDLHLDQASLDFDQGPSGLNAAGSFGKLNFDYQRTQTFSSTSSFYGGLQAQLASRNLGSAEKMSLGGPDGVRAYPVGEGVGDEGVLIRLEYRHHLLSTVDALGVPLTLLAFYDYGHLHFNHNGAINANDVNSTSLGAVGIGASLEKIGDFAIKAYLAWRTTDALPTTGDPDKSPRAWLLAQKWF